jgi:hypothetical protein
MESPQDLTWRDWLTFYRAVLSGVNGNAGPLLDLAKRDKIPDRFCRYIRPTG